MAMHTMRSLLRLDRPADHLTPSQFVVATVVAFTSAALWGSISGVTGYWLVIFTIQLYPAWVTPRDRERLLKRMLWSHVLGAGCAGSTALARMLMQRG